MLSGNATVNATYHSPLTLSDPTARLFALSRLVAAAEEADSQTLAQLSAAGVTPDLLDRLRVMPMGDAFRLALTPCGLSVAVDPNNLRTQFANLDRQRSDRESLEYMVRNGASPTLLTRMFALSQTDVRRIRRSLMPELANGGRPKIPGEDTGLAIKNAWQDLCNQSHCLRSRMRSLHTQFPEFPIASLELVVLPQPTSVPLASNS